MRISNWGRAGLAVAVMAGMLFFLGCPVPNQVVGAIGVGGVASGRLPMPHSRHRYSLQIQYPQVVTIYLDGHGYDPLLRVVAAHGPLIGQNDDGGVGLDSQLVLSLAPGSYFIEAAGYGPSHGAYTLTVR